MRFSRDNALKLQIGTVLLEDLKRLTQELHFDRRCKETHSEIVCGNSSIDF